MRLKIFALAILSAALWLTPLHAQPEFRGAWVATVYNRDWPSKPGLAASEQKAQLRAILDRAAQLKLNAILFQVRPVSDAFYASKYEPWSAYLTGRQGAVVRGQFSAVQRESQRRKWESSAA